MSVVDDGVGATLLVILLALLVAAGLGVLIFVIVVFLRTCPIESNHSDDCARTWNKCVVSKHNKEVSSRPSNRTNFLAVALWRHGGGDGG